MRFLKKDSNNQPPAGLEVQQITLLNKRITHSLELVEPLARPLLYGKK
jgi:hypothetical protein